MEKHYVCDECGSVSKSFGTCQNDTCIRQGADLKECHCEDGKHSAVMNSSFEETGAEEDGASKSHSDTILDLDSADNE